MNPVRVAECDNCGVHGPMTCRYERHDSMTDLWRTYLFCDGKCGDEWRRTRNRRPTSPGIITALGHEPGQERS